jgi:tetratricopeptide (TPR) repeat protein
LLLDKQHDLGLAELEKAVSLDPNSSLALGTLANGLNWCGKPEEAIGFVKKAMRVDPKYGPWVPRWLGDSYYWLRRYDEATAAYQEAIRRDPNYLTPHRGLAATYAEMGQEKEAQAEAAEILRLNPAFNVDLFRARDPLKNQADLDRLIGALRKAGLK